MPKELEETAVSPAPKPLKASTPKRRRPYKNSECERAICGHARHFSALLDRQGSRVNGGGEPDSGKAQMLALHLWELERGNLHQAIDSALQLNNAPWLLPIVRWEWRYLDTTSAFRVMQENYALLLIEAGRLSCHGLEMWAQLGLSQAHMRLGNYAAGKATAHAAYDLAITLGDREAEAQALHNMGSAELTQGHYPAAKKFCERSIEIRQQLGDRWGEAQSLNNLAAVENCLCNYERSMSLQNQSLAVRRAIGDRWGEGQCLNNLAIMQVNQGDYAGARGLSAQGMVIQRGLGNLSGESQCLSTLGVVEYNQGNYQIAIALLNQALANFKDLGDRRGQAWALLGLGDALRSQADFSAAQEAFSSAKESLVELGDQRGAVWAMLNLGDIRRSRGDYSAAEELYAEANLLQQPLEDRHLESSFLQHMGMLEASRGKHRAACEYFTRTLTIRCQLINRAATVVSCAWAGAELAYLDRVHSATVVLHGVSRAAGTLNFMHDPEDQAVINGGLSHLEAAVKAGRITAQQWMAWREQGLAMSIDELAVFTLAALCESE